MKKLQSVFLFGIVGAGIGAFVTVLSLYVNKVYTPSLKEIAVWLVSSFIIGVISKIMFTEKLPLLVLTAIHLVLTFATVLATNLILGYVASPLEVVKNVLPGFLIIYAVVYLIVFLNTKINASRINKELNK
ncbi:MAG: DUF3021 domain-containing protein [Clostridiales bacterium]|nr:DUF3021 domain-containing protein [Clostridiales bacterium]